MADEAVQNNGAGSSSGGAAKAQRIFPREIEEEMRSAYLDYAMSVLVSRALPDARDGLKPVQRRILFAMNEMGLHSGKPFRKSARIVGETLGKYHPHGETAIYDAMVRMAQDFSLRYPLVQGQGNFGSMDGDSPAAMRYTEARLSKLAEEMLADIDRETVDFVPNFDSSTPEPVVLPSKVPNLLVNGSSGIAVGMATSIPTHNIGEVIDAVLRYLDNNSISAEELLGVIKGPDFPTGAIIVGRAGIREAYTTGRGLVTVRSRAGVEQHHGRSRIVVTEVPYMVNKAALVEEIADLVRDRKATGISDLRDESNREGVRIVVELKKDADADVVLRQLYAHSRLETTFGINIVALVRNQPRTLNLRQLVEQFAAHRQEVVTRRTEFELKKALEKAHILEGLIIALNRLDFVIKGIRASKDAEEAKSFLTRELSISVRQAEAILDMRLQRLASLEQQKIRSEHSETVALIKRLRQVLSSPAEVVRIIREELLDLRKRYADARRTEIIDGEKEFEEKELVPEEEVVVTVTRRGYIKRMPVDAYRMQRRGGKGVVAAEAKEEDVIDKIFPARTRDYMLFFTSKGMVHWLDVYRIPEASRYSAGKAIVNLLELGPGESVAALMTVRSFGSGRYLLMCTRKGMVKKTRLEEYSRPRKGGIIAIRLEEGDSLINAESTDGDSDILLATRNGRALKFNERSVRAVGRNSIGVRGIRLAAGDSVIGMVVAGKSSLLTVTEGGYGKASPVSEYRFTARGGKGVRNIKVTEKNGRAVAVMCVNGDEGLMFITRNGITIRVSAADMPVIGRNTQGVRIMRLEQGDAVVGAAVIGEGEEDAKALQDSE